MNKYLKYRNVGNEPGLGVRGRGALVMYKVKISIKRYRDITKKSIKEPVSAVAVRHR